MKNYPQPQNFFLLTPFLISFVPVIHTAQTFMQTLPIQYSLEGLHFIKFNGDTGKNYYVLLTTFPLPLQLFIKLVLHASIAAFTNLDNLIYICV